MIKLYTLFAINQKMLGISMDVIEYFEKIEQKRKEKAKAKTIKIFSKQRELES